MDTIEVQFDHDNRRYLGRLSPVADNLDLWNLAVGQYHEGHVCKKGDHWQFVPRGDYDPKLAVRFGQAIETALAAAAARYEADMQVYRMPVAGSDNDNLFFTATFQHAGIHYRAAVAQNVDPLEPEYGGVYHVLLQSAESIYSFKMWEEENDTWQVNRPSVNREIVALLAAEVTRTH